MRVPTVIPVAGKVVTVRYLDLLDDPEDFGDFSQTLLEVRVSKAKCTSPALVWQTICHELGHAVLYLSGLTKLLSDKREESIVEAFEHLYAPIFRLNPRAKGVRWREVRFDFEAA